MQLQDGPRLQEHEPWHIYIQFEEANGAVPDELALAMEGLDEQGVAALAESVHVFHAPLGRELEIHRQDSERRYFGDAEWESLGKFTRDATSRECAASMLKSAQEVGSINLVSPVDASRSAVSDLSVCSGSIVFLRFATCEREPFYLIQHNFAVEAVFFPMRRCMVGLDGFIASHYKLRRFLGELHRRARQYVGYYTRSRRAWGGLLVANLSPNHFFYFQAPGLVSAFFAVQPEAPCIYTFSKEWYLDLHRAYGLAAPLNVLDASGQLSSKLFETGSYVLSLGLRPRVWRNDLRLRLVDAPLVLHALEIASGKGGMVSDRYDCKLWLGISSHKRAWLEEISTLHRFVVRVAQRFKRVLVVLDGYTSTVHAGVEREILQQEEASIASFLKGAPDNVDVLDLSGAEASAKISVACQIDFFITSHATASMYVARFCHRPGVTHISNSARAIVLRQHVHHDSALVPESIVRDIDGDGVNPEQIGSVSYSIDPDAFLAFACAQFEKVVGRENTK